jgi:hypothetical protein
MMMDRKTTKQILNLLDYLDGRGIVFEDEDLVREALKDIKNLGDW